MDETRISLLQRLRTPGDSAAWGEFVARYEPLLYAYARSKNVPDHDLGDLIQTIWISLLRSLPTFQLDRSRGRFRSWLYQVTLNAIKDRGRKNRRRAQHETGMPADAPEPATTDPAPDADWDRAFEQRMFQLAIEKVQPRTAPASWACFERYTLQGQTSEAVGQALDMLPNTVRKNASRVLERIRDEVRQLTQDMES